MILCDPCGETNAFQLLLTSPDRRSSVAEDRKEKAWDGLSDL